MFDVRVMRWIDNHVGNLICSIIALGWVVTRPLRRRRSTVERIVVMKFFGLGSIVVSAPALRALRDAYPDAELHFVTFRSNREILELLGLTDRSWFIDPSSPRAFVSSTLSVARGLRRLGVDLVIDLEFFAKFPLVLAALAGIPRKAGFYLVQEPWRRRLLDVPGSYNHYFHTRDIFLSLVYLLSTGDLYYLDFDAFRRRYGDERTVVPRDAHDRVQEVLADRGIDGRRLVVVNPNTSPDLAPEIRKWPPARYRELAVRLLDDDPDCRVVFIGTGGEAAYVSSIVDPADDPRMVSVAGELSLRELLALFAAASLVVSNDSGPMHLAGLVDAPVVGLFFADTPVVYGPRASRSASVAPALYSLPLFTVYNGKDVVAGRPVEDLDNTVAKSVSVADVLERCREVRSLAAGAPVDGRP
ncbi:MAG: glycosyltransferase family 9 protein [Acidimicrobiales bacterium]|nr:glycosyltransferase family 9 protein [Acidimicrobiales bacterium]